MFYSVALQGRQLRRRVLRQDEVWRGLVFPLLADHLPVALGGGVAMRYAVAQDDRPQEHHEVGLRLLARLVAEQVPEERNVAEQRYLLHPGAHVVLHQAAQRDYLAVVDQHGGLDGALVEGDAGEGGVAHRGGLLVDLQPDRTPFGDLRLHAQRQADVAPLDGLERRDGGRAAGLRILTGDERNVLPDDDP